MDAVSKAFEECMRLLKEHLETAKQKDEELQKWVNEEIEKKAIQRRDEEKLQKDLEKLAEDANNLQRNIRDFVLEMQQCKEQFLKNKQLEKDRQDLEPDEQDQQQGKD